MAYKILLAAMAAVVAASVADAVGSYDGQAYDATPTAYDDLLLQDLYKRLSMMTDNEDGTYSNAAGADGLWSGNQQENGDGATLTNGAFPTPGSEDEALKERLRDHEYLEHSSLFSEDGYNYLPGGAGEGDQPTDGQMSPPDVKTEEVLPFYCRPPNPCPKGYTAKDGCDEDMPDTEERQKAWIAGLQAAGECTCDQEHAFVCPKDAGKQNDASQLGDVIGSILGKTNNIQSLNGNKRLSVVAKKSPRIKRSLDQHQAKTNSLQKSSHEMNPYLRGANLGTVAKKGNIFHK